MGLAVSTRLMLASGLALLLADRLHHEQRRAVGWTLTAVGAVTTIPLVLDLFFSERLPQLRLSGPARRMAMEEGAPERAGERPSEREWRPAGVR
jgi:hypothetical protein